jgi:Family of unknown function (DUF6325)
MPEFRYGPVELYLVGFASEQPDAGTFSALADLLATGVVRLLDLVFVSKKDDGGVDVVEVEEGEHPLGLATGPDPLAGGLVADEDLAELVAPMAAGTSAVVMAIELTFAKTLTEELARAGGEVLRVERIPAPVVNALVDLYEPVEGN